MHSYSEEDGPYAEEAQFLQIDDKKGLALEEQRTKKDGLCSLPWALTVIFGSLLILQNLYYLGQNSDCHLGPVYDTDFGL